MNPGVLLPVAVVVVVAWPLALSPLLLALLLLAAPDGGKPDVEVFRLSNAGLTGMPKNGLAEKLNTLALGLSPLRVSVPSTVERLSLSTPCHHRVRASCGGTAAIGGETGSELARDDHTGGPSIGSEVIR